LDEFKSGTLTLRQYKTKTGKDITDADERNPMIDQYISGTGSSAVLLEDIGVDPQDGEVTPEEINELKKMSNDK